MIGFRSGVHDVLLEKIQRTKFITHTWTRPWPALGVQYIDIPAVSQRKLFLLGSSTLGLTFFGADDFWSKISG